MPLRACLPPLFLSFFERPSPPFLPPPPSSPQVQTDVVALLDEWAMRFFDELDYVKVSEGRGPSVFF